MKIKHIILASALLNISVLAHNQEEPKDASAQSNSGEQRLNLMEKSLNEIGASDDQRSQIAKLQKAHREKMEATSAKLTVARKNLSDLQESGATEEELDAAIKSVSNAQARQLKVLVSNRREMQQILGKEKYAQFMKNARKQYRTHEYYAESNLPARPALSPSGPRTYPTVKISDNKKENNDR